MALEGVVVAYDRCAVRASDRRVAESFHDDVRAEVVEMEDEDAHLAPLSSWELARLKEFLNMAKMCV